MLIKALSDYYDILADAGKVLPSGRSNVKIHYLVSLTPEGKIDGIMDTQNTVEVPAAKGKTKQKKVPVDMVMPQRTEKSGIEANIAEHRPLYLFGLNPEDNGLSPDDRTNKAKKSHEAFVETTLDFLEGLDSPLINAYRLFVETWNPQAETDNRFLTDLGKNYGKSGYAFCLSGNPDMLLQDEPALQAKWEQRYNEKEKGTEGTRIAQCAVSGENMPIARIHNKVKGVYGGLPTGSVLVGYNNPSETSYGNEQSYNSNISELVMRKYTEALNFLLSSDKHKVNLDDMTIVFWAMNPKETCENRFMDMLLGKSEQMNASQTEEMLKALCKDARAGKIVEDRLKSLDQIQPDVDFYMLGLKPNTSRLAVKFIIRKKYADVLWNIARFQNDIQINQEFRSVSIPRIKWELVSPKSKNETVNSALITRLLESIIYGTPYPTSLLETMVRRAKVDSGKVNSIRAGVIKACINRNSEKEELEVALNKENTDQAYLCGRLFAVLERLQQDASSGKLNRTIKDSYFASASSTPALVFPKLIRLSQNHLSKVKYPNYYNKLMGEIVDKLDGGFPDTLLLREQGKFIVGYYQQIQNFFDKTANVEKEEEN